MLTFYATFAEVVDNEQDMLFLSNVKSVCDVVYFSLGFALIPAFISMGINIRIIALIFMPLSLTMLIPLFLLKERPTDGSDKDALEGMEIKTLTLGKAITESFKNKTFIFWMFTLFAMTIGLQLFLGGINELFSSTGLNMTVVMASSFAPVPLTIMAYNKIVKIEAQTMTHMAGKHYIPAAVHYNTRLGQSIASVSTACPEADLSAQKSLLVKCSKLLAQANAALESLKALLPEVDSIEDVKEMAFAYHDRIVPAMAALRKPVDELELLVEKDIWPVPTYGDLMFEV